MGTQRPGAYKSRDRAAYWDGRNDNGEPVGSGVYFIEMTAGDYRQMRRIVLLK